MRRRAGRHGVTTQRTTACVTCVQQVATCMLSSLPQRCRSPSLRHRLRPRRCPWPRLPPAMTHAGGKKGDVTAEGGGRPRHMTHTTQSSARPALDFHTKGLDRNGASLTGWAVPVSLPLPSPSTSMLVDESASSSYHAQHSQSQRCSDANNNATWSVALLGIHLLSDCCRQEALAGGLVALGQARAMQAHSQVVPNAVLSSC